MDYGRKVFIGLAVCLGIFLLLLWSPWVTNEYAIAQVTQHLGGPNAVIEYNGTMVAVKDIPMTVSWTAFGKEVSLDGYRGFSVGIFGIFMEWIT